MTDNERDRERRRREHVKRVEQWERDTGDDYDEAKADYEATERSLRSSGE